MGRVDPWSGVCTVTVIEFCPSRLEPTVVEDTSESCPELSRRMIWQGALPAAVCPSLVSALVCPPPLTSARYHGHFLLEAEDHVARRHK